MHAGLYYDEEYKVISVAIAGTTIEINIMLLVIIALLMCTLCFGIIWKYKNKAYNIAYKNVNVDSVTGYDNYAKFVSDAGIMLKYKDVKYIAGAVDLSNFKAINDFYGRKYGDVVLKAIADRMHDIVMPDGIFARMFADKFVFLCPYYDMKSITYIIETYLSEVEIEISELRETIKINCNCGMYKVEDYKENINSMIDKALIACKMSKNTVSTMVTVLESDITKKLIRNQSITHKMNAALNNNEFIPYIQPKISFRDGAIVGGEALVRWMSADEGMIVPGDFIPLFEQNGFVTKVDFYMLEKVCSMIKRREKWGKKTVPISVNQSRIHVYDSTYINKLINVFDRFELDKNSVVFELTESAFTENTDDMIKLIRRMASLGYNISMDDFGCGYSSLNMLNLLPINELKLDQQFLSDESERSRYIIKNIVNLAHGLGISVVCEGVETDEQVQFLKKIGCDVAQGYYYAKPMPMSEFEKLLDGEIGLKG